MPFNSEAEAAHFSDWGKNTRVPDHYTSTSAGLVKPAMPFSSGLSSAAEKEVSVLDEYLSQVVTSNFIIHATPQCPKARKRAALLPGFSMRDWSRKVEQEKKNRSINSHPPRISLQEVQLHHSKDDLWIVHRNVVYDVTEFQRYHPCFENVLEKTAGHDITELVEQFHPWVPVHSLLSPYAVGILDRTSRS